MQHGNHRAVTLLFGLILFCLSMFVSAGTPVWTFTPLTPTTISIPGNGTAIVQYTVTNQSARSHTLAMNSIQGITQITAGSGVCGNPFTLPSKGSSCTLSLQVNGSQIAQSVSGGPEVCVQGSPLQCYRPNSADVLNITVTTNLYTVTPDGDGNETISPSTPQTVDHGSTQTFTVTANTGYTLSNTVGGTCPQGSWSGNAYTTGAITGSCSVSFSAVAVFPVAEGPSNVIAVPGNGQVTVSWTAPTNTGTGTISGYTVTYGPTSGTTFTTAGCTTSSTSCTVSGLTNGTAYTFAVTTTTTLSGANETGPATFSSSVTPTAGLAVSPSTLALSGLGSGSARTIALINNSSSSITISQTPTTADFVPALPSGTTLSSTTCTTGTNLSANGGTCTLTLTPGSTVSSNNVSALCTTGVAPEASALSVSTSASSVTADVVVLGYGCQYQGGYLFSIDDTAPTTSSIGGKVVATADQASSVQWSPSGVFDSIWGIDDTSTPASPSPNASSSEPATLKPGQLNCNAINDGACATTNMFVYYGAGTNYAAGLCKKALNNSGATCSGGSNCYTDWHLPSICELGPFGSTGVETGNYPSFPDSQSCISGSNNIQNELVSTSIVSLSGDHWSSVEFSASPKIPAWYQFFASSGSFQVETDKNSGIAVRCVRSLTN